MTGKEKCKILKQIRRDIAEKNDISMRIEECPYQGECKGTCPKCEEEVRQLERELEKRRKAGLQTAVAGVSAGLLCVQLSSCALPFSEVQKLEGEMPAPANNGSSELIGETVVEMGEIAVPADKTRVNACSVDHAWANWTENKAFFAAAANADVLSEKNELPVFRFTDADSLAAFRKKFEDTVDFSASLKSSASFDEIWGMLQTEAAFYNNGSTYFDENTLYLVYVDASSGSLRFDVSDITAENGTFRISVRQQNHPEVHTNDMAGWFMIVTVPHGIDDGCTAFRAAMR